MYRLYSFLFFGLTVVTILAFSGGTGVVFERGYIWYLLFFYFVVYVSFVFLILLRTFFDVKKDIFVKRISDSVSNKFSFLGNKANFVQALVSLFVIVVFASLTFLLTVRGFGLLVGKLFSDEIKTFGELVFSGESMGDSMRGMNVKLGVIEKKLHDERKIAFFKENEGRYFLQDDKFEYNLNFRESDYSNEGFNNIYIYYVFICGLGGHCFAPESDSTAKSVKGDNNLSRGEN